MRTLTFNEARKVLEEVVDEDPTYNYLEHYDVCVYAFAGGDTPACLIGHALHRLGVPVTYLAQLGGSVTSVFSDEYDDYTEDEEFIGVSLYPKARHLWNCAQSWQDHGKTWGEALKRALQGSSYYDSERLDGES